MSTDPSADDTGSVQLDFGRVQRIGFDEAILCQGKSAAQLTAILKSLADRGVPGLLTRLSEDALRAVRIASAALADRLDYDPVSRTAFFDRSAPARDSTKNLVAVISAGSSDMPVAGEAIRTLAYYDIVAQPFIDIGVAGLWRLTQHQQVLAGFPVVIVAAGMDGALPSVVGGLLPGVIIAVPTSTGYGASRHGETALSAALASCAPGVCVMNIDNGYGAACAALRVCGALTAAATTAAATKPA